MVAGRKAGHPYAWTDDIARPMSEHLDLADWRRRISALYAEIRADHESGPDRLAWFRAMKDDLFRTHSQSPIPAEQRQSFTGLAYWPHDPALRLTGVLEPDPGAPPLDLPVSTGDPFAFSRVGWVTFALGGSSQRLGVYWLAGYGGGIFIPFRDATSGDATYGGGRYLWDSAKGADLGSMDDRLVLDFNYAYHPSCVYDPRWSCPLAPRENWLDVPVHAGERLHQMRVETLS
jgi:uncharacterized protein (DUF1684 family)